VCPGLRLHRQLSTCKGNLLVLESRIADPHHFNADLDPDTAFHFKADPYPALHFNADPDPAPHQNDAYQRPGLQNLKGSILICRFLGLPDPSSIKQK
jgi:hypothetical protein